MSKPRKYHLVLSRIKPTAKNPITMWGIHFGDYDRECAAQELRDCKDAYDSSDYQYRLLTTNDSQDDINAAIAALNAKG